MMMGRTVAKGQIGFFTKDQANEAVKLGRATIVSEARYKLWPDNINKGLDNGSNYFLLKMGVGYKTVETEKPLTIDIKSKVNIWPFSESIGTKYDLNEALKGLSQEEQSKIFALWKSKKEVIEYANHIQ